MDKRQQQQPAYGSLGDVAKKLAPRQSPQAAAAQPSGPSFNATMATGPAKVAPGTVSQIAGGTAFTGNRGPSFNATGPTLTPQATPGLVDKVAKVAPGMVKPAQPTSPAQQPAQPQARPQGPDPFNSPTGFVGFNQYFGANAEAAQASAGKLNRQVQDASSKAWDSLQNAYGSFSEGVQGAANKAIRERGPNATGRYEGPTQFDPGQGVTQEFQSAREQRDALGSEAGVQALMGPNAGWLGAALTSAAGRDSFAQTQQEEQGLDTALVDARRRGQDEAERSRQAVEDYFGATQSPPEDTENERIQREQLQRRTAYEAYVAETERSNRQGPGGDGEFRQSVMPYEEWLQAEYGEDGQ
jgi:hypothetical protein